MNGHPDGSVDPSNWKDHEIGIMLNPRRGKGERADLLICDLLIKDADGIAYVRENMPEVSVGYEADYKEY
ncbi:DUF2213 domain-containing protein, partial [Erwinia amylovora]|nr:DUF2213 domain-containing protein [Erwinia amylovora]